MPIDFLTIELLLDVELVELLADWLKLLEVEEFWPLSLVVVVVEVAIPQELSERWRSWQKEVVRGWLAVVVAGVRWLFSCFFWALSCFFCLTFCLGGLVWWWWRVFEEELVVSLLNSSLRLGLACMLVVEVVARDFWKRLKREGVEAVAGIWFKRRNWS